MKIHNVIVTDKKVVVETSTEKPIKIGDIYRHAKTKYTFKVVGIETENNFICHIKLEQYGYYNDRINSLSGALDILYDEIELVTDKEELASINRSSCYC